MTTPTGVVMLPAYCPGLWFVETETGSIYLLDLDARTVTRGRRDTEENSLRRDWDEVPLYGLEPVRRGRGMVTTLGKLDTYEGYMSTTRWTSPVVDVVDVDGLR